MHAYYHSVIIKDRRFEESLHISGTTLVHNLEWRLKKASTELGIYVKELK